MFSYSYLKLQVYLKQTIVNQSNLPISSAPGGDNETGINRGVFRIRIFSVFFLLETPFPRFGLKGKSGA